MKFKFNKILLLTKFKEKKYKKKKILEENMTTLPSLSNYYENVRRKVILKIS
jgi:hypothetical protein